MRTQDQPAPRKENRVPWPLEPPPALGASTNTTFLSHGGQPKGWGLKTHRQGDRRVVLSRQGWLQGPATLISSSSSLSQFLGGLVPTKKKLKKKSSSGRQGILQGSPIGSPPPCGSSITLANDRALAPGPSGPPVGEDMAVTQWDPEGSSPS